MSGKLLRKTLDLVWRSQYRAWLRYAWHLVGNRSDAEDVVQDAVCRSLQAEPDLDGKKETDAYVQAAIRSISARHLRGRRRNERGRWAAPKREALESTGKSPLEMVLEAERRHEEQRLFELAIQGIRLLPDEIRQALELAVLRDPPMKLRQVAEIQGVAISTVHKRIQKAYRALRELDEALRSGAEDDRPGETS